MSVPIAYKVVITTSHGLNIILTNKQEINFRSAIRAGELTDDDCKMRRYHVFPKDTPTFDHSNMAYEIGGRGFRYAIQIVSKSTIHLHLMVCYSADGKSGFLTKDGIAKIKSGLAKEIFQQDLTEIYQRQTERRDELIQKSSEVMEELIQQMRPGSLEAPHIEQLMDLLAQKLKHTSGKKQYGYLRAPLKAVVDEIVDELSKDPRVAGAYDQWYLQREEVLRTYKDDLPPRLPLSQQKEFKRIKYLVIQEAVRLGEYAEVFSPVEAEDHDSTEKDMGPTEVQNAADNDEAPYTMRWNDRCAPQAKYRVAKRILSDPNARPEQVDNAVVWLTQAAEAGLG